ncbi:type II 3-dehydroquinate dehydratase [Rothia sp. CCM 9417]|uniref:type II 3-dehydroquinate dehydratase n=1 Tax=Rothia sp. CCM 9417 TaxID=3402657 RepID=UPI003ADA53D0
MAHRQTVSKLISVINGPNLNLLGARKPEVYGHTTLADIEATLRQQAAELGFELSFMQSNHEGDLVDAIQAARTQAAGIIINPAAYTHTSLALHDALEAAELPVVEVHLSNVHKRETFRHHSFVSPQATAVIAGAGAQGYELALAFLARHIAS